MFKLGLIYTNEDRKQYTMYVNCAHGKGIKFIRNEELISIGAKILPTTLEVKEIHNDAFVFKRFSTLRDVDILSGRGVLYPIKSIMEVNGLRPKIIPHYFADYDLSLRVNKKGYNLIISLQAVVYTDEDFNLTLEKRNKDSQIFKLFSRKSS